MEVKIFLGLLACSCLTFVCGELEGYKIYDVTPCNVLEQQLLKDMERHGLDFFTNPRALNVSSRIMVKPDDQEDFVSTLTKYSVHFKVVNEDVSKSINHERSQNNKNKFRSLARGISFSYFLRFDQINAYLDELAVRYPDRVKVENIGKSFEGRQLKTIRISNGDRIPNKNVIWIDAGIHAREWAAPATALYVINQLVENFAANRDLLAKYDWVILPVVNPDGYEYSHTSERMWRKTRRPINYQCAGTDGNRNFGVHWGEIGVSNNPCEETFKGNQAFSEPETQILRDQLLKLKGRAKFYLAIHAFGNYLLYPWAWTTSPTPSFSLLEEVAKAGASAIQFATGGKYTVGQPSKVYYSAAGGVDDWAFGVVGIPVCITIELPGAGTTGFDPFPQQILPIASEAWVGIRAMAQKVISKF